VRLLVDEMYPPTVAEQLRRRGHNVSAVTERSELRAFDDHQVLAVAQEERRALVTENVVDFVPLADALDQRGERHHGLVLVSPARYPRGRQHTLGQLVRALDSFLQEHPEEEPTSLRHWL
jgi:predicted nuclease of predicted toxin-antitoxin system